MIRKFLNKLAGNQSKKIIKKTWPLVAKINKIEEEYQASIKDQNDVLAKTSEFKERIKNGESVDDLLPEAFALVKTACRHLHGKGWPVRGKDIVWEMIPYDVQLLGGITLHQGNIAEMKTGEGKTLVSTMPVYLNALTERGVYLVTVNDYLAHRDAEWMGGLYNYLGLSVGVTLHGMNHEEKKAAYECDITYGTNNEFGFDYLRDNMATSKERVVQRELHYAIIDEVDSILIDEARTPLIISAPAEESTSKYQRYSTIIPQLIENTHYDIDEKAKTAALSEEGITKMEEILGLDNIYTEAGFTEVHHIEQALRAYACYQKDVDYIVRENQVIIIDQFTGRLMAGRRYGQGLHQAVEAKEKVEINRESKTLATVSFQNYFRLFKKLAGMTGTAETEAEEFYQIYGLDTIVIPTNKPIARADYPDSIYKTRKGKFIAAVKKIKELHQKGQPVLVGTISVERSEVISQLLKVEGVPHNVLNAKHHESEAKIVEDAGQKGAITIATNMAGRGTDIKLAEEVKELGGLFVLGTERHESRRIDNQLRGRSGRQGDAGASQFFVSMEDDLMRLFGGDKIKNLMNVLKVPDDMQIENRMISRSIESAQKKVEGRNFDIRKHLVEYDDVMNIHRNIIYKQRREFMDNEDQREAIIKMIDETAAGIVINHTEARPQKEWNYKEIHEAISAIHKENSFKQDGLEAVKDQEKLVKKVQSYLSDTYHTRETSLPEAKLMRSIEKAVFLRANDSLWMEHINTMKDLRENVAFSGYAQKQPLVEYKSLGFELFNTLLGNIRTNTVNTLFKIDLEQVVPQTMLQRSATQNMRTNEAEVSAPLSGNRPSVAQSVTHNNYAAPTSRAINPEQPVSSKNPVIIRASAAEKHEDGSYKTAKVGRNEPCPCGSGKKFKKCHGSSNE